MNIDLYKVFLIKYHNITYDNSINENPYELKPEYVFNIKSENEYLYNEIKSLKKNDIPKNITRLIFGDLFNAKLSSESIPHSVTHLELGWNFNQSLKKGDIPNSVTHLKFGTCFNQPLKYEHIPNSVTHLNFGICFNQSLKEGDIPHSVTHLTFGNAFNQPLKKGDIPNSVTHLKFSWKFNQLLKEGDIPDSVTHLTFDKDFNQELNDKNIPKNLIEIILLNKNYDFNKLKINKNIIVFLLNDDYYLYWNTNNNIKIKYRKKSDLTMYIEQNLIKDKLIGNIILKELTEKVFAPNRLLNICNTYNVDFDKLLEIY